MVGQLILVLIVVVVTEIVVVDIFLFLAVVLAHSLPHRRQIQSDHLLVMARSVNIVGGEVFVE